MTAVILAAGTARRMGHQKLLLPIGDRTMVGHVIDAAANYPVVVVAGAAVAEALRDEPVRIIVNSEPERGMSYSLSLADAALPTGEPIAVLLGDMPGMSPATIEAVISAFGADIDIVSPFCDGRPAHPVILGPSARQQIASLSRGDSLRELRSMANLRCRRIDLPAESTAIDIDTLEDYDAYRTFGSR